MTKQPEVWLRGSSESTPTLLQPASHAIKQAHEDVYGHMVGFPSDLH